MVATLVATEVDRPLPDRFPFRPRFSFRAAASLTLRTGGPFLQRFGNFSIPKANFKLKTCWKVAQFLAHKPLNFVSLTDTLLLNTNTTNKNSFPMARKVTETFRETGPRKEKYTPKKTPATRVTSKPPLSCTDWNRIFQHEPFTIKIDVSLSLNMNKALLCH